MKEGVFLVLVLEDGGFVWGRLFMLVWRNTHPYKSARDWVQMGIWGF